MNKREIAIVAGLAALEIGCGKHLTPAEKLRGKQVADRMFGGIEEAQRDYSRSIAAGRPVGRMASKDRWGDKTPMLSNRSKEHDPGRRR